MKLRNHILWLAVALIIGVAMMGCSPSPQAFVRVTATPPPEGLSREEARQTARQELADRLGVEEQVAILVDAVSPVTWPNSCLGLPELGETCSTEATPGYIVSLRYQGQQYHFHVTEGEMRYNDLISAQLPTEPPPEPEQLAREALAQELGVNPDEIEVVSSERRFWPNSGLGLARAGEQTEEGITVGSIVELSYQDNRYVYHVAGDNVRFNQFQSASLP